MGTRLSGLNPVCVNRIDKIPWECVPTRLKSENEINRCSSSYYEPAAKCVEKFFNQHKIKWHPSLFNAMLIGYLILADAANASKQGIGYSQNFTRGLRKIFFHSIFNREGRPLTHISTALVDRNRGVKSEINDVIKYVNTTDETTFLKPGYRWIKNKEAALLLLISLAISSRDPMKKGWENKYLSRVLKYFPAQRVKR